MEGGAEGGGTNPLTADISRGPPNSASIPRPSSSPCASDLSPDRVEVVAPETGQPAANQPVSKSSGGGTVAIASFRGPLRFELETSSGTIEAGKMFTVFVRITNPYDVPVTITSVETELPVEFWDPYGTGRQRGIAHQLKAIFTNELQARTIRFYGASPSETGSAASASADQRSFPKDPEAGPPPPVVLQPGNSHLAEFSLKTRGKTFFSPSTYNLHFSVIYEMSGLSNHDSVKTQLNIKAPISAMTWGVVPGAIIGSALRAVKTAGGSYSLPSLDGWLNIAVTAAAGILIGWIVVVAFARKKDAQPFLSVEDYYGGFFVGILAGYNGDSLLGSITTVPGTAGH